jgi:ABC-2 type transport system permease protein
MDAPTPAKPVKINRFLPYLAVMEADIRLTMHSWVYRTWVLVSVLAALGYLLYHVGVYREAGMVQLASKMISDLLRWTVLGSATLIVVLTANTISAERGTMADSVLSRGISRYQYFLAKWHARLIVVLGTFGCLGLVALAGSFALLHEDLQLYGCGVALVTVAALLAMVITCGVTVSAIVNSSMLSITILWVILYGTGFALSLLPEGYPSPDRALNSLPYVVRGYYDLNMVGRLVSWSAILSCVVAMVGLGYFARRDV